MSEPKQRATREYWATRIGLILAMAGNAIGLGNFLRFPVKAAQNGGGAFMIPYFAALLLLGVPLMWVEWSIGRYSGQFGYGTTAGAFGLLTHSKRWAKVVNFLGALGITVPLLFVIYYLYIESWTLAYSFFSLSGKYFGILDYDTMSRFLASFQGKVHSEHFAGFATALFFFFITLAINIYVLSRGIASGIEKLAKIALPTLFVFALILFIRVWTLGTPDPTKPENSIINGFAYVWNPQFSHITQSKTWMAAAGQIFFTLSIGNGSIITYASYLKRRSDIALTGLSTSITNEFVEVIFGGSIAIPVAVAFFGLTQTIQIAEGGAFDLGFVALPIIFQKLPLGQLFGMIWFLLLFFAGITSSVALCSPAIAFLQRQLNLTRKQAVFWVGLILLGCGLPVVFFLKYGFLDEMDFWAGTFGLVVVAMIEVVLFAWVFGMNKGWNEITRGADIKIPIIFKYIIKFITPIYLIALLIFWSYQDGYRVLFMVDRSATDIPYLWGARAMMLGVAALFFILVLVAYRIGTIRNYPGDLQHSKSTP